MVKYFKYFLTISYQFLQGPVQLNIAVPLMTEKIEWKLNGQTLAITLQLSDTVAVMKARIHEQTGMPPGKQKLQYEVDINYVRFYFFYQNINNISIVYFRECFSRITIQLHTIT